MEINKEKQYLELKSKILAEIEYREGIVSQLKWNSVKEKGFVNSFIEKFLKHKKKAPNLFWLNNETYGRYLIDADKELHNDIVISFEKSIEKLKSDYNNIELTPPR